MRIGKLERELNNWQWGIDIHFAYDRVPPWTGAHICVWCLKFNSLPEEGGLIEPKHYRGFNWVKNPNIDIIMYRKSFKLFGKRWYVDFPIKVRLN